MDDAPLAVECRAQAAAAAAAAAALRRGAAPTAAAKAAELRGAGGDGGAAKRACAATLADLRAERLRTPASSRRPTASLSGASFSSHLSPLPLRRAAHPPPLQAACTCELARIVFVEQPPVLAEALAKWHSRHLSDSSAFEALDRLRVAARPADDAAFWPTVEKFVLQGKPEIAAETLQLHPALSGADSYYPARSVQLLATLDALLDTRPALAAPLAPQAEGAALAQQEARAPPRPPALLPPSRPPAPPRNAAPLAPHATSPHVNSCCTTSRGSGACGRPTSPRSRRRPPSPPPSRSRRR